MRDFARQSPGQKKLFFDYTASDLGLPVFIIEKDFWVVWLLDLLFSLDEIKDNLTFKGGTSLSKVYNMIRRFSEDVDISVEKSYLGFDGVKDPEKADSRNKTKGLIRELGVCCKEFVQGDFKNKLELMIESEFSVGIWKYKKNEDWSLEIDEADKDGQTLLFYYPTDNKVLSDYVKPSVKIEIGARADHWPVEMKSVISYVAQSTPQGISNKEIKIRVLSVERTFWEKATILHYFSNLPEEKKVPLRQSRHYYDTYCLIKSDARDKALDRIDLLEKVAEHKHIYFRSGFADYESAKDKKTLKLIPSERVLSDMKKDYKQMEEMFFDEPPLWEDIVSTIREFQEFLRQ
jgi:hypothetical protein